MPYIIPADTDLYLQDAAPLVGAATFYGEVDGDPRVFDTGSALVRWNGLVGFDVSAIDAGDDEIYQFIVEGCASPAFTGAVQTLATISMGSADQLVVPLTSAYNAEIYRYFRLKVVSTGTTPSVTVLSWVQPLAQIDELSFSELIKTNGIYWGNVSAFTSNLMAWMTGAPDGGPYGDGRYPLIDGQGTTVYALCPAALAAFARLNQAAGTVNFTQYRQSIAQPDTAAGHLATMNAIAADNAVSVVLFDDGVYSPHGVMAMPAGARKVFRGGPKAIWRVTQRSPVLQAESLPVWVEAVSAITRTLGVNLSEDGARPTSTTVDVLTMAGGHALKRAQLVKIVSNDVLPGSKSDSAGDRRQGEFAMVGLDNTADTTKVTLASRLRGTYTGGIRVALIPDTGLTIEGFTLDMDSSLVAGGTTLVRALRMMGMIRPLVDGLRTTEAIGPPVEFAGCFQPRANGLGLANHHNIPGNNQFGYGPVDSSCEGFVLSNSQMFGLRHPQDTATFSCAPNDLNIWKYGPSRDGLVVNSVADSCSNGFGTHDEADGYTFQNCIALNVYQGAASGGAGFAVRGFRGRVIDCQAHNCRSLLTMSTIDGGYVSGFVGTGAELYGLSVTGGTSTEPQDVRVKVENSSFEITPSTTGAAPLVTRPTLTAAIANGGAGYTALDLLTLVGGDYESTAKILVLTVDGTGKILTVRVDDPGYYNTAPANPAAVTGGTGAGATFTCAFKSAFIEWGDNVKFSAKGTVDTKRAMDLAKTQMTGKGPTIDITGVQPTGSPDGVTVIWQQNYDDTLIRFTSGMRVIVGDALLAALFNAGVDGSDTPFLNAHEFPDTYVESDFEIPGASTLNPAGIYGHRWPNLAWSLTKKIAGVISRSDYIETAPAAAADLLTSKRLDRRITFRITNTTNFTGLTVANPDVARLPRGVELEFVNWSAGVFNVFSTAIPPRQAARFRLSYSGIAMLVSKTWSDPFDIVSAGVPVTRTGSYTATVAHVGGLQQLNSATAKTITLPNTARVGDKITFQNLGAGLWQFLAGGAGAQFVSSADWSSAPPYTRTGPAGTLCWVQCVANADGNSAVWVLRGAMSA